MIDATCPIDVNFMWENGKIETVIANVNAIFRNKGESPTTIEKVYLKIRIFPVSWMPDTPTYGIYYPGGYNGGSVKGLLQKKLWILVPAEFKKHGFTSFRIDEEDKISKIFSFIVPIEDIINDEHQFISLEGVLVAETVGDDTFESEVFKKGNFLFNRRSYPKMDVLVKNWSELIIDNVSQLFDEVEVQQSD